MKFHKLPSAQDTPWTDHVSEIDGLPLRDSGRWIAEKHTRLEYFAHLFATGMKPSANKGGWKERVYLELFSGPGKCWLRGEKKEVLGSPLRIIEHEFTRFIFVDINKSAAQALAERLSRHPNESKVEIWNGDCAEVIDRISIPKGALTLAFVDPTGIGHARYEIIQKLRLKTRCDLLINVQHAMGIKMNVHQYRPDADTECALTQFLGDESWKQFIGHPAKSFFRAVFAVYRDKLAGLGFRFSENQVVIKNDRGSPLYLLLFASGHPRGQEFWNKAISGADPQYQFDLTD